MIIQKKDFIIDYKRNMKNKYVKFGVTINFQNKQNVGCNSYKMHNNKRKNDLSNNTIIIIFLLIMLNCNQINNQKFRLHLDK